MAGHNKWSQIKRKKAVNDQKRGQMFTKLIRELTVAAREGGGDPSANARLRLAVDAARAGNMPHDNIDRAIRRGTGELEGVTYDEVVYEGYGPGGVALYIETLTDNQKRTVAEVRHLLDKNGGNLGTSGSVAWQFDRRGVIYLEAEGVDEDEVFEAAVEGGADDVEAGSGEFVVSTDAALLHEVRGALEGSRNEGGVGAAHHGRAQRGSGERVRRRPPAQAARRAGRPRRRAAGALQRGPGRIAARAGAVRGVVLGIDPGTAVTGFGVVAPPVRRREQGGGAASRAGGARRAPATAGSRGATLLQCGVIRTSPRAPLPQRLMEIHEGVAELVDEFSPAVMSIEGVFYGRNVRTAITLGHARGAIIVAAAARGVEVVEYAPRDIKKALTGTGSATKDQVAYMVRRHLDLRSDPKPSDAADGVAAALCHVFGAR